MKTLEESVIADTPPGFEPEPVEPAPAFPSTIEVEAGDTLQSIALTLYGHAANWYPLMLANRDVKGWNGFASGLEAPGTVLKTDLSQVHVNY